MFELKHENGGDDDLRMSPLETDDEKDPLVFGTPFVAPLQEEEPPVSLEGQLRENDVEEKPSLCLLVHLC